MSGQEELQAEARDLAEWFAEEAEDLERLAETVEIKGGHSAAKKLRARVPTMRKAAILLRMLANDFLVTKSESQP